MKFTPIPCHELLRPFIRNYWILTSQCTATGTQQIFSNGAASLQFYLTQSIRLDKGDKLYKTALFHQNMQKVDIISDKGEFNVFGAEFVPFCSKVFFRTENDFKYATPEDLGDEEFITLSKKIFEVESLEERVQLLDSFFVKRLSNFPEGDINIERLNDVFGDIIDTEHPSHVTAEKKPSDLASTACLSQKQFTRVFKSPLEKVGQSDRD